MAKTFLFWLVLGMAGSASAANRIEPLARTCNMCHGVEGVSAGGTMPSLGGLSRGYLAKVMKDWKYDRRSGATMPRIVKGLSDDEIDALASYFSSRRWRPLAVPVNAAVLARGAAAMRENCEDCHGPTGADPDVGAPRLDGQAPEYLVLELEKYRDPAFVMPHRKMRKAARALAPADVRPVADYYGAQGR